MRKMALMHLTNVTDSRSRQAIEKQVNQWEKNLEKLYIDHYRLKCYIASLQGTELPNPKVGCTFFFCFVVTSIRMSYTGNLGILSKQTASKFSHHRLKLDYMWLT